MFARNQRAIAWPHNNNRQHLTTPTSPCNRSQQQGRRAKAWRRVDGADLCDGDLVSVSLERETRFGLPKGRVRERLGSLGSEKAVSLIALHLHNIPHVFADATLAEADAARPARAAYTKVVVRRSRRSGPCGALFLVFCAEAT